MLVSARVTPLVLRSSSSTANSSSRFFSMEMENGSMRQGDAQSALAGGSGTRCSSCDFTVAEALAISTARAAQLCTPSRERSSVAAKPNAPSAITRIPMPSDSASEALPILPFLVASERLRSSTMRASASDRAAQLRRLQSPCSNFFHRVPRATDNTVFASRGTASPRARVLIVESLVKRRLQLADSSPASMFQTSS